MPKVDFAADIDGDWTVAAFDAINHRFRGMAMVSDFTETQEQGYYLLKYIFSGGRCFGIDKKDGSLCLLGLNDAV